MSSPGWVDLQVNGYAGVDFNSDDLTLEQTLAVCRRLRADGVAGILATVITAPLDRMIARLTKLAGWIDEIPEVAAGLIGLHVEGPFINPQTGFVGAHPQDAVLPATVDTTCRLLDAGKGHVRVLTLAPEFDAGFETTRHLHDHGIVVAAGHSDASSDQLRGAIDAGLKLYTHLGNGCPAILPRHDNIIQRVLSLADSLAISLIADGHHLPRLALRNFLNWIPDENIIVVSDAISAAGLGPGDYRLGNQTVHVDQAGACWAADRIHFAGSAATLPQMHQVLTSIGADEAQIDRWLRANPSRLLGMAST